MTFKANELEDVSLNPSSEWLMEEGGIASVKVFGFENFMCKCFNIDLDQYEDGWIDCYAYINPLNKTVTGLYLNFESNCEIEDDRELDLNITNAIEGKMIYDRLKTPELEEWLDSEEWVNL